MQKIENVVHKSIGLHCKRDAYTSECVLTDGGEKSERSSQSDWWLYIWEHFLCNSVWILPMESQVCPEIALHVRRANIVWMLREMITFLPGQDSR